MSDVIFGGIIAFAILIGYLIGYLIGWNNGVKKR